MINLLELLRTVAIMMLHNTWLVCVFGPLITAILLLFFHINNITYDFTKGEYVINDAPRTNKRKKHEPNRKNNTRRKRKRRRR